MRDGEEPEDLVAQADERAWDAQDRADADEVSYDTYAAAFRRARAIDVVARARSADSVGDLEDVIYEALHALDVNAGSLISILTPRRS